MSHTETTIPELDVRFQTDTTLRRNRLNAADLTAPITRNYQPALASLLLGLRFRTTLTDSERTLLDDLADEHSLSFLMAGSAYLHPENTELFPFDEIQSAATAPAGCVFTQVFQPIGNGRQTYAIMTVGLGEPCGNRLLFGMLVPMGLRRDQTAVAHFHEIAHQFDSASRAVEEISTQLDSHLTPDSPWLLVNRASGRLMAVSDAAARRLNCNPADLIDQEFGNIRSHVRGLIGRGLKMTSLGDDTLPLCLIRIEAGATTTEQNQLCEFLFHKMQNSVSGIRKASSYLQATTCWNYESDQAELARLIEADITELDQQLYRFRLLHQYERLETVPVDLTTTVTKCAEHLRASRVRLRALHLDLQIDKTSVSTPVGLVEQLLESIIQSHTQDFADPAAVTIDAHKSDTAILVSVRTALELRRKTSALTAGWRDLAECLAQRAGFQLNTSVDEHANTITTELSIPGPRP